MSKLHRIISLAGIETTGASIGDIVEQIGSPASGCILCSGLVVKKPWGGIRLSIPMQNLSQAPESGTFGAAITSPHGKTPTALPQGAPSSPSNGSAGTLVPPEAKEDSSTHTKPSTGIDKDKRKYRFTPKTYQDGTLDHYRLMESLPARLPPDLEHAAKKLLFPGQRGAKDELQDLREVIKSVQVYIDFKAAQMERDR